MSEKRSWASTQGRHLFVVVTVGAGVFGVFELVVLGVLVLALDAPAGGDADPGLASFAAVFGLAGAWFLLLGLGVHFRTRWVRPLALVVAWPALALALILSTMISTDAELQTRFGLNGLLVIPVMLLLPPAGVLVFFHHPATKADLRDGQPSPGGIMVRLGPSLSGLIVTICVVGLALVMGVVLRIHHRETVFAPVILLGVLAAFTLRLVVERRAARAAADAVLRAKGWTEERGTRFEPVWISSPEHLAAVAAIVNGAPPWRRLLARYDLPRGFPAVRHLWGMVPLVMRASGVLEVTADSIRFQSVPYHRPGVRVTGLEEQTVTLSRDSIAGVSRYVHPEWRGPHQLREWTEVTTATEAGSRILLRVGGARRGLRDRARNTELFAAVGGSD